MKKLLVMGLVMLALLPVAAAAQEDKLTPGEPLTGTITNKHASLDYGFNGKKGTPLVFELKGVDPLQGFKSPALILKSPSGAVLADTDENYQPLSSLGAAYVAVVLPEDGVYTLVATRKADAVDGLEGEFTLTMIEPTPLAPQRIFQGEVSSQGGFDFYTYAPEQEFYLFYYQTDGDYHPEVSVNQVDPEDGTLTGLGYASGDELTFAGLGIYEPGQTYFVVVGEATISFGDFYFNEETAAYELGVRFPEK